MIEGRILQTGSPAEIYAQPGSRAVAEFVGHANVIPGAVDAATVTCALGRFPARGAPDGPADVVIRTESVALGLESGVPAEVTALDFFGHDQVVTVVLQGGMLIRALRPPHERFTVGQAVGVSVMGEVLSLPAGR
jgi:ABC-type Fe3+/spermidine/putrescine transport system ATPase subunit